MDLRGNGVALGLLMALVAVLMLPVSDGLAKHFTQSGYHAYQVVWVRYFAHFVLVAPFVFWTLGLRSLTEASTKYQIIRGVLLTICTVSFFYAVQFVPLADAIAVIFLAPIVVTALSGPMLGEKVGWRRWTAVIIGFIGALIITRPGFDEVHWALTIIIGTASLYGLYLIYSRKVAQAGDHHLISVMYPGLVGLIIISGFAYSEWQPMPLTDWLPMLGIGIIAAASHGMIAVAMRWVEASLIAPMHYLEIIGATIVGYLVWGDFPGLYTWIGCAIILSSGGYIAWRESKISGR